MNISDELCEAVAWRMREPGHVDTMDTDVRTVMSLPPYQRGSTGQLIAELYGNS